MKKLFKIYKHNRAFQPTEKGQVLLIVLVLMLVGILFITSTMGFMSTAFKTNQVYVNNTISLYASEAGIQDGIWNILNQTDSGLQSVLTPATGNPNPYTPYDYGLLGWNYNLVDPQSRATIFNTYPVNINMKNTWVPLIDNNIPTWVPTVADPPTPAHANPPSVSQANNINNNVGGTVGTNLYITGQVTTVPFFYQINITYTGTGDFPIKSIGCWLPQGFTYNNGSCNLNVGTVTTPVYLSGTAEQVLPCAGNQAVVWTLPNTANFDTLLNNMGQTGVTLSFTFQYTTSLSKIPEALAWMVNKTNPPSFPYAYTWDFNVTLHDMTATAGNTAIEAYVPKSQTRMLGNAISGDYVATGGSNRTDTNGDGLRETVISSSSSTVNIIPSTATVEAAYLYWAGWMRGDGTGGMTATPYYDPSVTLGMPSGSVQTLTLSGSDDPAWYEPVRSGRTGTITFTPGSTTVYGSGTQFTTDINTHGGHHDQLILNNGTAVLYQVASVQSNTQLTLSSAPGLSWTGAYFVFDGYYYACKKDVTEIVRDYSSGANIYASPAAVYGNGNGTYTMTNLYSDTITVQHQYDTAASPTQVGDSAYAGWSLVIIYSDVSTLGHQLYLFDEFKSIANNSLNNLIPISGFITPARISGEPTSADAVKLTTFVGEGDKQLYPDAVGLRDQSNPTTDNWLWDGVTDDVNDTSPGNADVSATALDAFNGESINGASTSGGYLNASGVDIDTFHVKWLDNLVQPNDTTAALNIYTNGDGLVSIYVIASFRSSVTSGGAISYLIKRKNASP